MLSLQKTWTSLQGLQGQFPFCHEAKKLMREETFPAASIPINQTGRPPEPFSEGYMESSDDSGIQLDLTTLTSTPRSSLLIVQAELNGVRVSALIDSGAQGCFISHEAEARLPYGRKKHLTPVRIRGATGRITNCFESLLPDS